MIKIESKFYEEVHELECKYAAQYAPLFDRVSTKFLFKKKTELLSDVSAGIIVRYFA